MAESLKIKERKYLVWLILLDNRVPDSHITKFESFIHSHDALVGLGYDNDEMVGTNWRGVVYRFGIIGTVIMLLLIFQ